MESPDMRPGTYRKLLVMELAVLVGLVAFWGLRRSGALSAAREVAGRSPSAVVASPADSDRQGDRRGSSGGGVDRRQRDNSAGRDLPLEARRLEADDGLSALREPTIVVDKTRKLLAVLDGGRVVRTYPAAVGGGRGDKTREGDRCTPEGEFYVCLKNPQSRYVLSLGLSYPAPADAERGLRDGLIGRQQYERILWAHRTGRQPPWNTPLGGEIMIHGQRDGGRETQGCIALENEAIRELYPAIPVGTRVVIRP